LREALLSTVDCDFGLTGMIGSGSVCEIVLGGPLSGQFSCDAHSCQIAATKEAKMNAFPMRWNVLCVVVIATAMTLLLVPASSADSKCEGLPTASQLTTYLVNAANVSGVATYGKVGGLFEGRLMWAAVVNRNGDLCAIVTSTTDPTQVWPGSNLIAQAKAYTANAFSLDNFALSTARLYTFTQPGHSLWSLGQANLQTPASSSASKGGMIFFGGGVPLYSGGKIIGALGISGDTSCADHEIAKRVRDLARLNPAKGMMVDDIVYSASVFAHPVCLNTYKNGKRVGNESAATYPFVP
jgi:uncharacterized protein GlcG (DUF336 family)